MMFEKIKLAIEYAKNGDSHAGSEIEQVLKQLDRLALLAKADIQKRRELNFVSRLLRDAISNAHNFNHFIARLIEAENLIKKYGLE